MRHFDQDEFIINRKDEYNIFKSYLIYSKKLKYGTIKLKDDIRSIKNSYLTLKSIFISNFN